MSQRIDGDAAAEIEIALAAGGDQPGAFAALEHDVLARAYVGITAGEGPEDLRFRMADTGLEFFAEEVDMGPISLSKTKKPRSGAAPMSGF